MMKHIRRVSSRIIDDGVAMFTCTFSCFRDFVEIFPNCRSHFNTKNIYNFNLLINLTQCNDKILSMEKELLNFL